MSASIHGDHLSIFIATDMLIEAETNCVEHRQLLLIEVKRQLEKWFI